LIEPLEAIAKAAEWHGVKPTIFRWINFMLKSRNVTATLSGETLKVAAHGGEFCHPCY
jgi:hypothetical protein